MTCFLKRKPTPPSPACPPAISLLLPSSVLYHQNMSFPLLAFLPRAFVYEAFRFCVSLSPTVAALLIMRSIARSPFPFFHSPPSSLCLYIATQLGRGGTFFGAIDTFSSCETQPCAKVNFPFQKKK
eukprot:RCo008841